MASLSCAIQTCELLTVKVSGSFKTSICSALNSLCLEQHLPKGYSSCSSNESEKQSTGHNLAIQPVFFNLFCT